jgi:hypothetical protein
MTSKNVVLLFTVIFVVGLIVAALRQQAPEVTVWDVSGEWASSAHADRTAEAFVHWDEDDPPVVPAACARCHSYYGFADFLGADGSAPGAVDTAAKIGSVLFCTTCHNEAAPEYRTVEFPSGARIEAQGFEALCMTCHHGRQSTVGLDAATAGKPVDEPIENQGFINPHYFVAAATQAGGEAQGGYQYQGRTYVPSFGHTETMDTCIECHNPHSLRIDPKTCSPCHANVEEYADLGGVRQSSPDYDGDGDTTEGIASEIQALRSLLYDAMRDYAASVLGAPIAYHPGNYPYYFVDSNDDGKADEGEAISANRYVLWPPRLLRAAYNYQFVEKDPGGFVHGPQYQLQLLYDSLEDLSERVSVEMAGLVRASRPE